MVFSGLQKDIKSFISGRDLVVFAIGLALSTQFQATLKSIIDGLIMPFVSSSTGVGNLATRAWELNVPKVVGKETTPIKVMWGSALQSVIVFFITLIIMVKIAKYVTVHYVKSTSVSFN